MPDGIKQPSAFDKLLEDWEKQAKQHYDATQATQGLIQSLSKQIEEAQRPPAGFEESFERFVTRIQPLQYILPRPPWARGYEVPERVIARVKPQITNLTNQMEKDDFYYRLYGEVPYVIAGGKSLTADDILSK